MCAANVPCVITITAYFITTAYLEYQEKLIVTTALQVQLVIAHKRMFRQASPQSRSMRLSMLLELHVVHASTPASMILELGGERDALRPS
jgi:hypothetical protein